MSTTYEIKLPQFEGPFDLLLFFIERDELDIYNIPISQITADFLDYIHQMKKLDIELASEFILVAATLMRIKAHVLLPRKEIDEEGNEIDPREELVQKLLEYKQFKGVIDELKLLEAERAHKFKRGNIGENLALIIQSQSGEAELHNLDMYKLLHAFHRVIDKMEKRNDKPRHQVIKYAYTIGSEKKVLLNKLSSNKKTGFEEAFGECEDRIHAIFTFLAMLELIQLNQISINLGQGFNTFWLKRL